jgi:hypothetical protein
MVFSDSAGRNRIECEREIFVGKKNNRTKNYLRYLVSIFKILEEISLWRHPRMGQVPLSP